MNVISESRKRILERAAELNRELGKDVHDRYTSMIYQAAGDITTDAIKKKKNVDRKRISIDSVLTSRLLGMPAMLLLLGLVFWLTIEGANIPSAFLASILMEGGGPGAFLQEFFGVASTPVYMNYSIYEILLAVFGFLGAPWWLTGFLVDGVYLGMAWVVSVMLPPMAIFFPLFTLLEDMGYLPRIALNMDKLFRSAGAHGKQALTMAMGFGCNAAGVIACRIIESPRERIIAMLTNNFVPCNGRWPTMILLASIFVAAAVPAGYASLVVVLSLVALTLVGVITTLLVSKVLSSTVLKGLASSFVLELPPYRKPQIGRIIYTSIIDRTWFVLKRAIIWSAPAGGLIWLLGAISVGDQSLFQFIAWSLNPAGQLFGMDGVILLAFIFAIPANEIVIPTIIMGYMNAGRMLEVADPSTLFFDHGWSLLTAVCVMLFSLLHYPCTTTSHTIWAETRSVKWTLLANLIPLGIALVVCFTVAQGARLFSLLFM